jgi:hypothetical protein
MYRFTSAGTTTRSMNPATSGLTCRVDLAEPVGVDFASSGGHGWLAFVDDVSDWCFLDDTGEPAIDPKFYNRGSSLPSQTVEED